ncbi:MAG: hypothetical protein U0939_06600 [Pirellulales bacterium]
MRTQLFRKVTAIAGWGLLAGVLTANAPSYGDEPTPAATSTSSKPACCTASAVRCTASAVPMLSRIPYLNRLFKNQPLSEAGEACVCVDEVYERIGIDFDFSDLQATDHRDGRFEFEFTAPTTSRLGVQVAEFAGPVTASCRPRVFVFSPNTTMQLGLSVLDDAPVCGTCPSECSDSLAECDKTCTSCSTLCESPCEELTNAQLMARLHQITTQNAMFATLTEAQEQIAEARTELLESLMETQITHLEEKHALQLEIAQIKAKLEFQSEREKLQAEIADLRHENTALQLQVVFSEKAIATQQELAAARAEIARLAQRSSELEAQLAKAHPAGSTLDHANVAEQPAMVERR